MFIHLFANILNDSSMFLCNSLSYSLITDEIPCNNPVNVRPKSLFNLKVSFI